MKFKSLSFSIVTGLICVSCSGLVESTRESLLGDEKPKTQPKQEVKWVSKVQYDQLMVKYKNLNEKYEQVKMQNFDSDQEKIDGSTETVDVFGKNGIIKKAKASGNVMAKPTPKIKTLNPTSIGEDLDYYKKAIGLKVNGKTEESLKIFQFLENSKSKQISVRAKKHIGDIYFTKGQFDLSLQVFEDIIRLNAFSGVTLSALNKASKAAEQLGLMDKKAQYESLLKDVFDTQV